MYNFELSPNPLWRVQLPLEDIPALTALGAGKTAAARKAISGSAKGPHLCERYYFGIFAKMEFGVSRWCDGTFPVWYGADSSSTALHEVLYHAARQRVAEGGIGSLVNWRARRSLITAGCNAMLLDMVGHVARHKWLVADDYSGCQKIGRIAYEQNQTGIRFKSARSDGVCAALYKRDALMTPESHGDVFLCSTDSQLEVRNSSGKVLITRPMPL